MPGILNAELAIPQFPALDQFGPNTTLLLHGDGTNGAQNNTFLDSSANNFTITRNGNTTQGTFGPFSQPNGYWSNFFNGATGGDYLSGGTGTALQFSGNFTIECWVYPSAIAINRCIISNQSLPTASGLDFGYNSTGNLYVYSNTFLGTSTTTISANQWSHVALVRSGTTCTFYINGSASGTFTSSTNFTSNNIYVATNGFDNTARLNAYLSNLRVVNGSAVYTSNFTPSTTPLTAITNTSLLTSQSNRFVDNSTNAFTLTPSGTPSAQAFKPFSAPTAYYPAVNGGAGYFDGSGDYLTLPSNAAFNFGTSTDFTIEGWFYLGATSGDTNYRTIVSNYNNSLSPAGFILGLYTSGTPILQAAWNTITINGTTTLQANVWYNFAFTRSGSNYYLFLNGAIEGTASGSVTADNSGNWYIGRVPNASQTGYFNGYISNFRVVKGTAVYTSTFTPPTVPLTAITNTSLLLSCTNAGIIDSVSQNQLETVGNAQVSTTQSKFGGASMYFDGASSVNGTSEYPYISGTGDFTAEFWVYPSSLASYNQILATTSSGGFGVLINSNGTISYTQVGVAVLGTSANSVASGVWSHVAVARSSGVIKIFVNGNQGYSGSDTTNFSAYPIKVGRDANASSPYTGYVDDLRITKGIARYTQNFTPPQNAYPDYGPLTNIPTVDPNFKNTTLLLHGNGTNGAQNNTFLDSSTNNFTITRNGNTTQGTFTPFSQPNGWWSNYFDGTGNSYLSVANNAALNLGTGDFTIEAWIYPISVNSGNANPVISQLTGASNTGWLFGMSSTSLWQFSTGTTVIVRAGTVVLNQWTHLAAVRISGTTTLYVNGSSVGSTSSSFNFSDTASLLIGYQSSFVYTNCYVSNARIIKGTGAYTSNFTPSSLPLTAITNTSLLTCQSNRFVDNSSNAFAITAGVTTTPQNFYPFFPPLDYSTAAIGGSAYLDGSGDYLSSSVGAIGTGDFTVEFYSYWDNTTTSTGGYFQISTTSGGLSTTYTSGLLAYSNSGTLSFFIGSTFYGTTYTIVPKQWIHIAIVRSSGTVRAYVNGVSVLTPATDTTNISATYLALGGYYSTSYLIPGYLSNFRVLIGTALYTSNFTPPTAPLTAITNTSFLLSATNGGIFDNASKRDLETVGNAQISTTQSKFGGSSMSFTGTSNYLVAKDNPIYSFGTGDFTVECWIYLNTLGRLNGIWTNGPTSTGSFGLYVLPSNAIEAVIYGASGVDSSITLVANTWYHVAASRSGSTLRVFINGVQSAINTSYGSNNTTSKCVVGDVWVGYGAGLDGYIDDLRITNGVSRYRYNFTPPAAPFPNK